MAAGVDALVEHADFASAVSSRVNHLVRSGHVNPTIRDGLATANLLATLEAERPVFDEDDLARVILIHLQAAEDTLPAEQCQAYLERVAADPVMRGMSARWERAYGAAGTPA